MTAPGFIRVHVHRYAECTFCIRYFELGGDERVVRCIGYIHTYIEMYTMYGVQFGIYLF